MKTDRTLQFSTANIPAEGTWREGEVSFQALDIDQEDRFSFPTPLRFQLHMTVVNNDVMVTGKIFGTMEVICDRCTKPGTYELEQNDVFHRHENAFGDVIDLTDDLREDILLIFPQSFICSPTCLGLCLSCGCNLNIDRCTCNSNSEEDDDNPWRKLDNLKL